MTSCELAVYSVENGEVVKEEFFMMQKLSKPWNLRIFSMRIPHAFGAAFRSGGGLSQSSTGHPT